MLQIEVFRDFERASMRAGQAGWRIFKRFLMAFSQLFVRSLIPLVGMGLFFPGPALAVDLSDDSVSILAGNCVNCHGPSGRSLGAIPTIRGVNEEQLRVRLMAFREGRDAGATVMTRLMKGYDADQIAALAKWFARDEAQ